MRNLLLGLALLASACTTTTPGSPVAEPAQQTTQSTPSASSAPTPSLVPQSRTQKPEDYGFTQRSDGEWESRDGIVAHIENGEVHRVRSVDGSLDCWDLWLASGERPNIGSVIFTFYYPALNNIPKGSTVERQPITMYDVRVGQMSCRRT